MAGRLAGDHVDVSYLVRVGLSVIQDCDHIFQASVNEVIVHLIQRITLITVIKQPVFPQPPEEVKLFSPLDTWMALRHKPESKQT